MSRDSATSLAPGFRFHPTDEELVRYYLKRKILNKPCFDAISVIDIYRSEPWDLPDKSKLKSRDLEWYFFSALDKKYGNGSRTNRATERGYWKTTGKDRAIHHKGRVVGMKKTLVFHKGRAPRGERTNWVMHEYRLTDEEFAKSEIQQDAFVLCRVFQKSGSGPKNGEQYGAPFVEEEWEDDEKIFVPGQHAMPVAEVVVNDDTFVEVNDIDQNLGAGNPAEAVLPLNFYQGDSSNHVDCSREFIEDYQKPPGHMHENAFVPSSFYYGESSNQGEHSTEFTEDYQKPTGMHATEGDSKPHYEHVLEPNGKPVKDEYVLEPTENINPVGNNYLLDESYLDVNDYLPANDGFFLEADDLSIPIDPESDMFDLEEYLTFSDADDKHLVFDSEQMVGSDIPVSDQEPLAQMPSNEGTEQVSSASEHKEEHGNGDASSAKEELEATEHGNSDASSSKQKLEATECEPGTKYPFLKQASHMLGSFPAPPAFASEFPSKDVARKLNSAAQASSSVHVMAGVIRIANMTSSDNQLDWSYGKNGNVNIVVSFSLPQGYDSSSFLPMASLFSGKNGSVVARGWFFLMLFWVLIIISAALKFRTCIYTR